MLDRTMSLVDRGLIRITSRSQHRPDRAVWRGLPLDKRAMTVAVKQEILKSTARKETAKKTQLALNVTAAQQPGIIRDPRGACLDRAEVPENVRSTPL